MQTPAEAKKPEDWDEDEDGDWEPPKIANPKCEKGPGCGEWKRPNKPVRAQREMQAAVCGWQGCIVEGCCLQGSSGPHNAMLEGCPANSSCLPTAAIPPPNTRPLPTEPCLQGQVVRPHD